MALQPILGGFQCPAPPNTLASGFALTTSAVINAASGKVATIFAVPKAGNIRKIRWATRTVTTGATIDVRLETASASSIGIPSGTLVGTNTNNNAVVVNSADDNVAFVTTLTADAAVTAGQIIALVFVNPSTSFGNMQFCAAPFNSEEALPYTAIDTLGSGYSTDRSYHLCFSLEYDDASIVPIYGLFPATTALGSNTLNTGTTPDVAGLRFQVPFPARIVGAWLWGDFDGDYKVMLVSTAYNQGAGTGILASSGTIDSEYRARASGGITRVMFTSTYDLVAATTYRLVMEPQTGTSCVLYDWPVPTLAELDAFPGGRDMHLSTAKDPTADGSWTNYNSGTFRRPMMGLLIDSFADDTGGSVSGVGKSRIFTRF